jgi:hypothetical protein
VASLFTVAFVIATLPRDREPTRVVELSARPLSVMSPLATTPAADQPAIVASAVPAVSATGAPLTLPPPTPVVEIDEVGADAIFTFSAQLAELPVLPSKPLAAAGTPDVVMSPPALEADGDHVISTAFRQTGAVVILALRKTGEGVKTAFTSVPW